MTYNQRKAILKLLETLLETQLLKDAAIPNLEAPPVSLKKRLTQKTGLDVSA